MINEILLFNYWEHFKAIKDLAKVLPPDNERIKELTKAANEILKKMISEQELERSVATDE